MKNSIWITLGAIVLFIAVLSMSFANIYNSMVSKQEEVTAKWAQVENQYQRRADLIPNLVNTVQGYAQHEKSTLDAVISARAKATSTNVYLGKEGSLANFNKAQGELSSALSRLMVVSERYPDLKANVNFSQLQAQLEGTENRISVERKRYNDSAKDYNRYIRKFPNNVVKGMFDFEKLPYFESKEGTDIAPVVKFN
ncbi:MAG: LemA family protein [Bacteroidetes bacterium]|nr:LemA family protein [Bacteroidota bacterium]